MFHGRGAGGAKQSKLHEMLQVLARTASRQAREMA